MNPKLIKNTFPKILTLLCFLALPALFYVLTAYLTAAVFQALLCSIEKPSNAARFLETNLPIIYSGCAAIFTLSILGPLYRSLKKNGSLPASSKRRFPVSGYLYVIAFGALGAIFFNLFMELSRLPELLPTSGTIEAAAGDVNPPLHFLVVCLILPSAEELVFRGFGYFGLRRLFSPIFTSVLTAALFGIFHGNAPQTFYGFCMGLLLAHATEHCWNLTFPLLFHWAANLTSFFFLQDPAGQPLLYSIPILGLSGMGCVWLFYRIKNCNGL